MLLFRGAIGTVSVLRLPSFGTPCRKAGSNPDPAFMTDLSDDAVWSSVSIAEAVPGRAPGVLGAGPGARPGSFRVRFLGRQATG